MTSLDKTRLILGWQKDNNEEVKNHLTLVPISRLEKETLSLKKNPVYAPKTGHIVTFSPPGPSTISANKSASLLPNLLHYEGSAIIIDPEGDNYTQTHHYRKTMGQDIYLIDPFNVTSEKSESLNFLSPLNVCHANSIEDYFELASTFLIRDSAPDIHLRQAIQIIAISFYIKANDPAPDHRNITAVYDFLNRPLDLIVKDIAQLEISNNHFKRLGAIFQSMQQTKNNKAFELALSWLEICLFSKAEQATSNTTFPIEGLSKNRPMTLYIIIPQNRMKLYAPLIRLWLTYIMQLIELRRTSPKTNTILFLDEAAQYASAELIIRLTKTPPKQGLQLWSFWDNLKQVELIRYDFENYLTHDAAVVQTYGALNNAESYDMRLSFMDAYKQDISSMTKHQQFLQIRGQESLICHRLDSVCNDIFQFYGVDNNRNLNITSP